MDTYLLRPAIESERALIFDTYRTTVGPYVAEAGGWDEDSQRSNFWLHHPLRDFQTIRVGDEFAGGLHVEPSSTNPFVSMVFLAPKFQGLGIGSKLLSDLHQEANEAGHGLILKVLRSNPARRLYERLGFVVTSEDAHSVAMRWA